MNEPENQGHPDPEFRSLENKVRELEGRIAEQQDQLRDYEKSLVERIGDVDDDRRTTATQLQRAWQSQLEAFNDRFRRQRVSVIGALVLFLVVVGVALFLAYQQANSDRQLLADEFAELKQELARTSGQQAGAESVQAQLSRLSEAVDEIASSQGRQDGKQADELYAILNDERMTRDQADSLLGAKVQRLEVRLESLRRKLEIQREAKRTTEATKAPSGHGLATDSPAGDNRQDSAREPAETVVEPASEVIPAPPVEASGSAEEMPAAAEQPITENTQEKLTDTSPDAETPNTLVVANDSYALQLIGFYSLDNLLSFADRNDLPSRLYYKEETVQGQPWYALIHSLHDDYASAEAQLHNLSPELIAMDPWIRPVSAGVELTVIERGWRQRQ